MALEELMPKYESARDGILVTFHDLETDTGRICGALTSQRSGNVMVIRKIEVIPWGELPVSPGRWSFPKRIPSNSKWLTPYISPGKSKIRPEEIYEIFNRPHARSLLTGHLIVSILRPTVVIKARNSRPDINGLDEFEFKFNQLSKELTLTEFTAQNYRLLTDWLESSPVQILAFIEGSAVLTIRNRLQSARELGYLENPGSGKRSARKH